MNTKTIKTKIEDWYDDLVFNLRHIRGNTRAFFTGLGRWFSYFKILVNVYDFDYSSIIVVERHQITRVRDSIIKYQSHVNWERDVDHINLALKLLDIIEEDGCSEEQIRKAIDDYIEVEAKRQKEHTEFEERCKREQRKRLAREKENAYFGV